MMEIENIERLIHELRQHPAETPWLEFKRNNDDPDTIGKNICALANSAAYHERTMAYMVWGIDDHTHELKGTSFHWATAKRGNEELESWLRHELSPNANFEFKSLQLGEKWYGILMINPAIDKTVKFKKVEYIRIGSYTKQLNDYPQIQAELWNRLQRRNFESQIAKIDLCKDQILHMLDYVTYFSLLGISQPNDTSNIIYYLEQDDIIRRMDNGLYAITNLGAILLAKRIADFPSISRKAVRVAQFKGNNHMELLKEHTSGQGYASGFENLMNFLYALIPSKEAIGGSLRKRETPYPQVALREAIANALIHQDLTLSGTGPVIELYDNRIEISNPGLPLVSVMRIIDSPPKSRNEKLASLMRRMGVCEELGSGWDKIVLCCENEALPAPRIETYNEPISTKVTLFSFIPFSSLTREEKLRACYLHACITYVSNETINNSSLRKRFLLDEKSSSSISRLLKDAVEAGLIHSVEPNTAPRYQRYAPIWG